MSRDNGAEQRHVVVVGGGFAGVGCVKRLAREDGVAVTLIDRHNYHQFQPLLYQVATSQLASSDIAFSLRKLFRDHENVDVKLGEVAALDPAARTVTLAGGERFAGDALVVAAGSRPNFFRTPGAEEHALPLYSLDDATRLRSRILEVFEAADRDAALARPGRAHVRRRRRRPDRGRAGRRARRPDRRDDDGRVPPPGGQRGADPPRRPGPHAARPVLRQRARLRRQDPRPQGRAAAPRRRGDRGRPGHVSLADGSTIRTRCVVWGGGIQAPAVAASGELPRGRGGRIEVQPDLTVAGAPGVYAIGDVANIPAPTARPYPQLGSVALQSGTWAAENILADAAGKPRKPFHYHDKGIMAMIGRGAAIAEVGAHRHELHGAIAFSAWLGVHASLMTGVRNRIDAFIDWGWDYFTEARGPQVLDRPDAAAIDWDEDLVPEREPAAVP